MKRLLVILAAMLATVAGVSAQNRLGSARALYAQGDYQSAMKLLYSNGGNDLSAEELALMGDCLYELEAYDFAAMFSLRAIEGGLQDKQSKAWAYTHMAVALEEHEEYGMALDCLNKAVKLQPNDAGILAERGGVYYALGKLKPAEKDLLKSIQADSTRVLPYMTLAYVRERQGRIAETMALYNRALQMGDYRDAGVLTERSVMMMHQGDTVGALRDLVSAVGAGMSGRAGRGYNNMLDLLPEKLGEVLERQMAREPFNPLWPALRGDVEDDGLGRKESAMGYYYRSLMTDAQENTDAAKGINPGKRLMSYLADMGAADELEQIVRIGLEANPESNLYENGMLSALMTRNEMDSVIAILTTRMEAQAENEDKDALMGKLSMRARALYLAGRYEEAVKDLDKVLHESMNNTTALLLQGKCFYRMGDQEKTNVCMQRVIENMGAAYTTDTTEGYFNKKGYIYHDNLIQAYWYSGDTATAQAGLAKRDLGLFNIKRDGQTIDAGDLYNEACLYGIMGMREEALAHLDTALANGYMDIAHIREDEDMACLHGDAALEALLLRYDVVREEKLQQVRSAMVAPDMETLEQKAHFPGAEGMLEQYLLDNVRPIVVKKETLHGMVEVEATIAWSGEVTDVKVVGSAGNEQLDAEALRVVSQMPRWEPTRIAGRAVEDVVKVGVEF